MIEVREERSDVFAAIREVNHRTFGQPQEGHLVDALPSNGAVPLSLVATLEGQVVGASGLFVDWSPVF